jgi:hypothetical protein
MILEDVSQRTWWVTMNFDNSNISFGDILPNMKLESDADLIETYTDISKWIIRLEGLDIHIEERLKH